MQEIVIGNEAQKPDSIRHAGIPGGIAHAPDEPGLLSGQYKLMRQLRMGMNQAGDSFICLSDGIVEAAVAAHHLFGFSRLEAFLRHSPTNDPEQLVQTLVDQVWRFAGGPPDDDVTVLVAQVQ